MTMFTKEIAIKAPMLKKLTAIVILFTLIIVSIYAIRSMPKKESEFIDNVANQIEQEMEDNQIVVSKKGARRTVVEFKDPIILAHGKDSRLIVYTAELSETVVLADEGWGGWKWVSTYQKAEYHGLAEYTVDLSKLSEEDFIVNNELKTLTVRIPYAVLSPINILNEKTKFYDPQKGWAAPKNVELSSEEHSKVMVEIKEKMKAQLIDQDIIAKANEEAKTIVAELLATTVHSIDPEFTVVVVH